MLLLTMIVNTANYISVNSDLTQTLELIERNQGTIPFSVHPVSPEGDAVPPPDKKDGSEQHSGPFGPETPFSTRFFVLHYTDDGTLASAELGKIAAVTEDDVAEYLAVALRHGAGFGYYSGYKYLVTDDGSGPAYADIFSALLPYAEVLTSPENRGKGHALKCALRHLATDPHGCRAFITADADGQHTVADILRVREALLSGSRFVLTTRTLHGKSVPLRSRVGNGLSRFFFSLAAGCFLEDNQSGLRGFSTDCLPWLTEIGGEKYDYEMNVLLYAARQELSITQLPIETVYLDGNQSSHFDPLRDTLRIYRRMLDTARGSVLAWLLHVAAILLLSLTLGWHFFLFSIPLCGAGSAALSYCFNRFLVFRRVRYACGPRMLFGAAVRTSLRLLFCCILHPLGLPLFAAWLIGSVLTVPLEYAYVRLTGPWWSSYALRRS